MRNGLVCGALVAVFLAAAGCGRFSRSSAVPGEQRPTAGRPPTAVSVIAVEASDVTQTVTVVGSLSPKFSADIKSEVSGTIAEVYVTEWRNVRKGSPLARLDTSETEAVVDALRAARAQAQAGVTRAQREYRRALQLEEFGLLTPQARDEARSALDAADAVVAAAQHQERTAEARLSKSFINAPMDGIVAERHVSAGDRVENMGGGASMFRIVDNRSLDLTVTVPTPLLTLVHVGQPIEFTTDAEPGRRFQGRITYINPEVDETSRSVRVSASVPNLDGRLKGGLFIRGEIAVAARRHVLHLPRQSLIEWNVAGHQAAVFVVCDGRAEKRIVQIGAVNGAAVEIVDGLVAGEPVVTRGVFALRPDDAVVVSADSGA